MDSKKIYIVVDSREPSGLYTFKKFPDVVVIRDNLFVGDYSLMKHENEIVFERKQLGDFISCCGKERGRFEAELKRMTQDFRYLLIIGSLDDIYYGNFRSKIVPKSVYRSLFDWTMEYRLIPIFVSSEGMGQQVVYDILKMFKHNLERGNLKGGKNNEEKS